RGGALRAGHAGGSGGHPPGAGPGPGALRPGSGAGGAEPAARGGGGGARGGPAGPRGRGGPGAAGGRRPRANALGGPPGGRREGGLALDPEHVGCTNLRAMALVKLGRNAEAGAALADTLANDPENAFSHANQGWALLHQGQPRQALEHFREALRLEPGLEFARAGILEAIKARNPVYGLMLRYFLWMGRLRRGAHWAVILGLYFVFNCVLGNMADANPAWRPWVMPLQVAYIAFVVLTWIAEPLFNLLLRLDRFGRHALTREEIVATNWVGGLLTPALVSLV